MSTRVLNPALYQALVKKYKEVRISNQGLRWTWFKDSKGTIKTKDHGEQYYIRCPMCEDEKLRCTISHINGLKIHPFTSPVTWLIQCYNCGFGTATFKMPKGKTPLGLLLGSFEQQALAGLINPQIEKVDLANVPRAELIIPGTLGSIVEGSAAHTYLTETRKLNPKLLEQVYGMRRITDTLPQYKSLEEHLYIPSYEKGVLVSWQSRDVYGSRPNPYYIAKASKKTVFNLDLACQYNFLVICEGVFDAIACGNNGVALFGKTITSRQMDLFAEVKKPVIVALDPEATEDAAKAVTSLREVLGSNNVFRLTYPTDWPTTWVERKNKSIPKDAADMGYAFMKSYIQKTIETNYGTMGRGLFG